jgi:prevent-host-death family protein
MPSLSEMGAADFKAHCLRVMEEVRRTRRPVTITKRGVPIAKLVPADPPRPFKLGTLAGRFTAADDLVEPAFTAAEWAENEREWDELDRSRAPRRRKRRG